MITTLKDLSYYRQRDFQRYNTSFVRFLAGFILGEESSRCIRFLRIPRTCEYLYNNRNISPFHKFLCVVWRIHLKRVGYKYKLHVGLNVCGPGVRFVHIMGGIIINCKSVGENFTISSDCIIGKKGNNANRAVLGNNVSLSIGAKVIGKVVIGNNVIIAPNSVVVKDVPSNVAVSGVPAVIIKYYGQE